MELLEFFAVPVVPVCQQETSKQYEDLGVRKHMFTDMCNFVDFLFVKHELMCKLMR